MTSTKIIPTQETYFELQRAYDFFNDRLFSGRLPYCLITLQREKHTRGYFSSRRFVGRKDGAYTDEIAMNPSYFGIRSIVESLSTLVHEMTHLDQQHHGKPGRGRYHNKEWADLMIGIGLHPSNTGKPGGKMTGDQMTHYIIEGGAFDLACQELITQNFTLSWIDRFPPERAASPTLSPSGLTTSGFDDEDGEDEHNGYDFTSEPPSFSLVFPPEEGKQTRTKYTCPVCKVNTWGKKGLVLLCGSCDGQPIFLPERGAGGKGGSRED